MAKHHSISRLPEPQRQQVLSTIRRHRYMGIDAILEDIREQGIDKISRSALGRYLPKLKAYDELNKQGDGQTVVLIVARDTGEVRLFNTSASPTMVLSHLANMPSPEEM